MGAKMADDRYGLSAFFEFTTKGDSLATLDRVENGLRNLEKAVKSASTSVASSNLGANINQQLNGVNKATSNASNQISSFAKSTTSHLNPLKSEFRALRAEARNIDFGDLDDPATFKQARNQVHGYIDDLKKLESQVTGNTTADRQFKAELIRNQSMASNKVDIADSQRNSAIASQRAGTSAAIAGGASAVALPAIGLGTAAVNITAGFDDQMSAVSAVLSAQDRTSENMLKLREQAKSIGASTKFSATDAASGLVLLAQSGQTVEEQLKSIEGTTLLAAAGGLDLATATDITVSSLGQFGLKATDAVHVANVLAYNAGAANLDVADLGESLKYAGPAASKFGASFEETNAILDVLSESGIRASQAGTALKTMFINLASPSNEAQKMMDQYGISVKDSSGNMLSTVDVMAQLQSKLSGLASGDQLDAVSTIFGKEATPAALSMVSGGADKMKAFLKGGQEANTVKGANGAVGSAAVQAGIMEDNIGGSFRNLSSAIEGVQIEMGEVLVPAIRFVVNTLSSLLTRFIELPKPIKTAITITAALVTGIAAITAVVASAAAVFFTLQSAIGASAIATTLMSSTLIPLTGFATTAIASFGAAGFAGSIGILSGALTTAVGTIAAFGAGIFAAITSPLALATAGILALYAGLELLTPGFNVLGAVMSAIVAPFAIVFGFIKGVVESVATALAPVFGELSKLQSVGGPIGEAFTIAGKAFTHFAGVGEVVGKIVGGAVGVGIVVPLKALISLINLAVNSTVTLGQFGAMIAAPFIQSIQFIQGAVGGAVAKITGLFGDLLKSAIAIGSSIISAFNPMALIQSIPNAVGGMIAALTTMGMGLWNVLTSPFKGMMSAGSEAVLFLSGVWENFTSFIVSSFLAIPNAIGGAISALVPSFLKKAPEKQQAESTPENGMVGAATQVQSAWSGFGDWFGGSMDGMVDKGVDAGKGLVNALNHNPTVKIPIAWEGATSRIGGMLSGMLQFAGVIGNGLSLLFGGAIGGISKAFLGLGLTGVLSMLPLLPMVAAIGFGVFAVSQNIFGLKTVILSVVSAISGLSQGFMAMFGGLSQTAKGVGTVIQGAILGNINLMGIGADRVLAGLRSTFDGLGIAIRSIFGGAIGFVQGLFQSFGSRSSVLFKDLAVGIQAFFQSPINAIMALIDSVEIKIRSVGESISKSPIGTIARGLGFKGRGETQTVEGGIDMAKFDDQVAAINPTPITPQITPAIRGAAESLKLNVNEIINPTINTTESLKPNVNENINPITAQIAPAIMTAEKMKPNASGVVNPIAPTINSSAENLKPNISEGLNSASSAVSSLGAVLGLLSPVLAAPLMMIGGLLSAVTTIAASIPILSGAIGGLTGATGLFATASGFATTALGFLGSTAAATWAAISGPLLPIIAGIAAIALAVTVLVVAFQNNFLGISSLFSAIGDGIGEIFGGIQSAWDGAIGGILTQLDILGQTIVEPFKPLIAMFSSSGEMAGVGGFISNVLLTPFKILATAIGFAIGTIGKAIEAVIVVGSVIAEIVLQPITAIVGVILQVGGAVGGLVQAMISPFAQLFNVFASLGSSIQGVGSDSIGFGQIITAIANTALMPLRVVFFGISKAIEGVGLVLSGIIGGFTLLAQIILLPVNAITLMISGIVSLGQIIGSVLMAPFQMVGTIVDGFINSIMSIPSIVGSAVASIPFFGGILTALAPQQEVQHFAVGGQVLGGGGIDKEPAMLTAGEFVIQNSAVGAIGLTALEAMNSGDMGGAMTAMMKYLPPIPQMLFPAPIPVPVATGGEGSSGGINLSLNVASISVVAPQGNQSGDATRAMMMDLLDQLMPHLDRAVSDILRTKAELVR